ncbi:glycine--tRNA ligase subunit beta [Ectothiorhodospiraceae bacterium BW-2]|nr:glycine--tRNA ligase subunit beta [Ectothiorhodospiraceae bacterium BW-2]
MSTTMPPSPPDLLIEIGTEELPPKALNRLSRAFSDAIGTQLEQLRLPFKAIHSYATPRRLAVIVTAVSGQQPDQSVERRGPALKAAYDSQGKPTKALLGFAHSCGVPPEQLEQIQTPKGSWLLYRTQQPGQSLAQRLPQVIEQAVNLLPIPKRMRWGDLKAEFVRPVHWLTVLYGEKIIPIELLAQHSNRVTFGHRFMAPAAIELNSSADYLPSLQHAFVVADFEQRREQIRHQIEQAATTAGGRAVIDPDLLDEVTAMVEWPTAVVGSFDPEFLRIPAECLISAMKGHQKYFHLIDDRGKLLAKFITISNISSRQPHLVQQGNERVIRPRLADAAFFWQQDQKSTLDSRYEALDSIIFQQQLGTLKAKSERLQQLMARLATELKLPVKEAQQAARLCQCDLLTDMVGEFPELQGVMGRHYAVAEGIPTTVAAAMNEIYLPRHAGDTLPQGELGTALAIADRIDTLVGIFAIGQKPSGTKDPFALRRAALALLRLTIERQLPLNIYTLLQHAATLYQQQLDEPVIVSRLASSEVVTECFHYILERCNGYFSEQGIDSAITEAVIALSPPEPLDIAHRIEAVKRFQQQPQAAALAAANKRISNILRKNGHDLTHESAPIHADLFQHPEEQQLWQQLQQLGPVAEQLFQQRAYSEGLTLLATLKEVIDPFFDQVMVMAEDSAVRQNRLTLLSYIQRLFSQVADIAALPAEVN